MNLNKIFVLGNIAKDPEIRTTPGGSQVASFSVATNRVWYNQNKEKQQEVEFHNIVAWGKLAEISGKYLKKGGLVLIEGRIKTRTWQAQDGTKKYRTEIIAESLQLGPRPQRQETNNTVDQGNTDMGDGGEIGADEVPF